MNRPTIYTLLTVGLFVRGGFGAVTESHGKEFPTANAAARALVEAAQADNTAELMAILGPSAKDIVSSKDPVQDRKVRRQFVARAAEGIKVIPNRARPHEMTLVAGKDEWPLPVPIVESGGKWYFDMVRGRKQILMRRVGSNELDAIEISRGYVEAQHQYAAEHQTPEGVPYYAQKIISSPGEHDGLYWTDDGTTHSPLGPAISRAIAEGYSKRGEPYHGYYFRILTGERSGASETPVSYVDNGRMTKGFALVAWPAEYGSTGIMTFIVNKSGIVYQKNLGRETPRLVQQMERYDSNSTWVPVSTGVAFLTSR
jgi:hypothetical protein